MNIKAEVWAEAEKRGLDWICTGGGCDYISRIIKTEAHQCQMTLTSFGSSPESLTEECEVGIAFHSTGYVSVGIPFKNVIDALDFMQKVGNSGIYFMEDQYKSGKGAKEGLR